MREAVSTGRWHYTADQCQSLTAILQERLTEHQSDIDANMAFDTGLEGGVDSSEENLGWQLS